MNVGNALKKQIDDIDSRNTVATAKVTSIPKVVSNSNI
jgi:hypothetical protein